MRSVVVFVVGVMTACGGGATAEDQRVDATTPVDSGVDTLANEDSSADLGEDSSVPSAKCTPAGAGCAAKGECCSGNCAAGKCQPLAAASLDDDRDRVLETLAGVRGDADRCATWGKLDDVQKGLFLTHTDMLGNRSCMENAGACSDTALAHVFKLWAINGNDPGCSCTKGSDGYNCCNGGGEWHRMFFSADDALMPYLRNVASGLPEWGDSKDLAGPHDPFTQSDETSTGSPRGQVHFWAKDADAKALTRTGVKGVLDAHIVELDNDYNILHDSNPEGCYGVFGLGCTYGRAVFKKSWSDKGNRATTTFRGNGEPSAISELASDAVYAPRCPTAKIASASAARVGSVVTLTGSGFKTGGVVHFRTRAGEVVVTPFAVSATELRVVLPLESPTGEAYAWAVVDGVITNLLPLTVEK